jgi:broad specificity phosphatase PhoE
MPRMGTLHLVRHAQASFGSDDYDQLSPLGWRQAQRLGEHLQAHGLEVGAVLCGTLRRHRQTWEGMRQAWPSLPEPVVWPGLDEYDSAALIEALHAPCAGDPHTPEGYRAHFRLLRDALRQWMDGVITPRGMPSYEAWRRNALEVLEHARQQHAQGEVLVISSGGPIATLVGHLLGVQPETTVELNLRLRNTALSEVAVTPKRCALVSFNTLPHLSAPQHRDWITYA